MDTAKLAPGYVHQGFSLAQSKAYELAATAQEKSKVGGYFAGVGVSILTGASRFVEIPFKTVEDVALTLINLVGSIFNKGCRKNLKHCGVSLLNDLGQIGLVVAVVTRPIFALLAGGLIILMSLSPKDYSQTAQRCKNESLKIDAIRKHGYNKVRDIITLCSLLNPEGLNQLFTDLPNMASHKVDSKIKELKKDFNEQREKLLAESKKQEEKSRTEGATFPEEITELQTL